MKLESYGFPAHLYSEKDKCGQDQRQPPEVAAAAAVHHLEPAKPSLIKASDEAEPERAPDVSDTVFCTEGREEEQGA